MIELKPCPFCGGEAHTFQTRWTNNGWYTCCPSCDTVNGLLEGYDDIAGRYETEAEAVAAWNTRTPPSDWREARELLDATFQPDSGNLTAAYLVGLADGKATKRTCRIRGGECDQCGAIIHEHANLYWVPVGDGIRTVEHRDVHYCPNCGAKVVDE